jgi:hypothetical protein
MKCKVKRGNEKEEEVLFEKKKKKVKIEKRGDFSMD